VIGDTIWLACLPLRWVAGKAWALVRGFDADAEYAQIMDDLRKEQLRQGEGR
jgi:hypothetical protein